MSLMEMIMDTPVRVFSGVRSRRSRWPSESIWEKTKNSFSDFKYNLNRKKDSTISLANKLGVKKFADYTGISKAIKGLGFFAMEGIGIPGIGGAGTLLLAPQQNVWQKRFNRPAGAPTRNSVIWGLIDTAAWLYGASLLGGLGVVGKVAQTGISAYKWAGLGEIAFRGTYNLITKKNMGITSVRVGYEIGKGAYNIFKKSNGSTVIPTFKNPARNYNITNMNYYTGTKKRVA